jgi:hypothetical protein
MLRKLFLALAGAGVILGAAAGAAQAWDCQDGHYPVGNPGHPEEISCLAAPSDTGHYCGYYVGGGAPCRGDARCPWEGTWGWDYCGLILPKHVMLGWYHGRRYQGGLGSYLTTGTKCRSNSSP